MKHTLIVSDINSWLKTNEDFCGFFGCNNDDPPDIEQAFDARTPALTAEHKRLGLYFDNGWLYCDTDTFGRIRHISGVIVDEFDNGPGKTDYWHKYDLSGDDDVDYNGSYIDAGLDALKGYLRWKEKHVNNK